VDLSHVSFLGNLKLNLWDCGGQEAFMENYLSQQRAHIFSSVGVLIYVFDIESRDIENQVATYISIMTALAQYSPGAKVFILIHKMDLIQPNSREAVFEERVAIVRQKHDEVLRQAGVPPTAEIATLTPFATSIWDQSLYKAWASILHDLIPNLAMIEENLGVLGQLIEAEEILLFERTSFLVVSVWSSDVGRQNPYTDRFERMSNVMKHFKSSLANFSGTPRGADQFKVITLQMGTKFQMFVGNFTTNTYIMVILPPGEARFNAAKLNVAIAREQFEPLDVPPVPSRTTAGAKGTTAAIPAGEGSLASASTPTAPAA